MNNQILTKSNWTQGEELDCGLMRLVERQMQNVSKSKNDGQRNVSRGAKKHKTRQGKGKERGTKTRQERAAMQIIRKQNQTMHCQFCFHFAGVHASFIVFVGRAAQLRLHMEKVVVLHRSKRRQQTKECSGDGRQCSCKPRSMRGQEMYKRVEWRLQAGMFMQANGGKKPTGPHNCLPYTFKQPLSFCAFMEFAFA